MMLFLLVAVFILSSGVVEGGNTIYHNSEIANLTIAINKLLTQFTHKCPITEQSNSRDTINDLMQLVLTKQLLSVDSSSSCCPSQPNSRNKEGIQQAIGGLQETIDVLNSSITAQKSAIVDRLDSLTDAVSNFTCPDHPCEKQKYDSLFTSCEAIHREWPRNPSGYYSIADSNGSIHHVYCHMESLCNLGGGWMRIVNMKNCSSCPDGFRMYSEGPATSSGSCVGTIFPSSGIEYSQVCGKVIGYQVGHTDAAAYSTTNVKNINKYYVDGISLTHGCPRKHIWTLMSGASDKSYFANKCPCGSIGSSPAPSFVGSDYYCESGYQGSSGPPLGKFFTSDRLWDGKDCGSRETACGQRPLIPWFYKSIGYYTTDYIEMRICCSEGTNDEDVPFEQYELYVK